MVDKVWTNYNCWFSAICLNGFESCSGLNTSFFFQALISQLFKSCMNNCDDQSQIHKNVFRDIKISLKRKKISSKKENTNLLYFERSLKLAAIIFHVINSTHLHLNHAIIKEKNKGSAKGSGGKLRRSGCGRTLEPKSSVKDHERDYLEWVILFYGRVKRAGFQINKNNFSVNKRDWPCYRVVSFPVFQLVVKRSHSEICVLSLWIWSGDTRVVSRGPEGTCNWEPNVTSAGVGSFYLLLYLLVLVVSIMFFFVTNCT